MIVRVSADEAGVLDRAMRQFGHDPVDVAAFVSAPGTIALVAVEDDAVQGWCWGYLLPRPDGAAMLYLHHLEVDPHRRRQGVGRALVTSFMDAGTRLGARRMFLTTAESNSPAKSLYESLGGGPATHGPTASYWFRLPGYSD